MTKILEAFQHGDGAHCGLSDWYDDKEAALQAALDAHQPFDTGWYGSKKEIASARIWSDDGVSVNVEASVSDDFDTEGLAQDRSDEWTLDAVAAAVDRAWNKAEEARRDNADYEGFSVHDQNGAWVETYVRNASGWGDECPPPGDNYYYWGWQHSEGEGVYGIPHPAIPAAAVEAFEEFVEDPGRPAELTVEGWTIRPWRN